LFILTGKKEMPLLPHFFNRSQGTKNNCKVVTRRNIADRETIQVSVVGLMFQIKVLLETTTLDKLSSHGSV
jgi:hypothetical protein